MFGHIINILIKQDDERRRIVFLLLKIFFTGIIAAKFYSYIFGSYYIISITDFKAVVNFFMQGTAFICFTLFFIVWVQSYEFISFILTSLCMKLSSKLYDMLCYLINNPNQIVEEISKNERVKKWASFFVRLLNSYDIFKVEKNILKPSRNFYKFYNYLLDIETEKQSFDSKEFTDTFVLVMQFFLIYYLLDLHFLSLWLWVVVVLIGGILIMFSIVVTTLALLIDIQHSRLLILMRKLEGSYKKTNIRRVPKITGLNRARTI